MAAAKRIRKGRPPAEYRIGPDPDGIRFCISCMQPIEPGEIWLRRESPDLAYAVGVHVRCDKPRTGQNGKREFRQCSLCGYIARDGEGAFTGHFAFVHRIRNVAALATLVA